MIRPEPRNRTIFSVDAEREIVRAERIDAASSTINHGDRDANQRGGIDLRRCNLNRYGRVEMDHWRHLKNVRTRVMLSRRIDRGKREQESGDCDGNRHPDSETPPKGRTHRMTPELLRTFRCGEKAEPRSKRELTFSAR